MALYTLGAAPILTPAQVGALLVQPVADESVAVQVSTRVDIPSHAFRIPIITADPTAAWVAEGAEIAVSDATLAELVVTPTKLAGLSIISRELADDSSPEAQQVVGDGLGRDIARKLDAAFFGNLPAPAPGGLAGLAGVSTAGTAGTPVASTDTFADALSAAEQVGAQISAWVANPATALTLAKLKKATGSNEPLLQPDPTKPTRRTILGVPLYVSPAVAANVVWGIPGDRVFVVIRDDARIDVDGSVFFTSDRVAVRATMRVGFAFPHPAAIVKVATG